LSFHSIIFLHSKHHLLCYSYVFSFLYFATTLIFLSCVFSYYSVLYSFVPNRP
jgi:hypothetical protein